VFQYKQNLDDEKNSVYLHVMMTNYINILLQVLRLDSKKSLSDQLFEGTYWLICSPVKLLKVMQKKKLL
jgi:hypothetical protein